MPLFVAQPFFSKLGWPFRPIGIVVAGGKETSVIHFLVARRGQNGAVEGEEEERGCREAVHCGAETKNMNYEV